MSWAGYMAALIGADAVTRAEQERYGDPTFLERVTTRLARVLDEARLPVPERAETGRVLATLGDPRPGVGLRADGLPDIAWVHLEGGRFAIGGDKDAYNSLPAQQVELEPFWMAKYPVTNAQWQAFLDDPEGYGNERWWREAGVPQQAVGSARLELREPSTRNGELV